MNYIRKSPDGHSHQRNDIRNRCLISGFPTKYLILSSHRSIVLLPENTWLKPSIHGTDGALFSSNKEGNAIILTTQWTQTQKGICHMISDVEAIKKYIFLTCRSPVEWWLPETRKWRLERRWSKDAEFQLIWISSRELVYSRMSVLMYHGLKLGTKEALSVLAQAVSTWGNACVNDLHRATLLWIFQNTVHKCMQSFYVVAK